MRGVLVCLVLLGILAGCSGHKRSNAGSSADWAPPVPTDWVPEKTVVKCAAPEGCPAQVGLLMFVFPEQNNSHKIRKCTGFLTGPKIVMSNGHCDYTEEAQGYFITPSTATSPSSVRKVVKRLAKKFTPPPPGSEIDSGRPDVATYELEEPIEGLKPLELAKINDPPYTKLIGFVVNSQPDRSYSIEKIECEVRRHESIFPYDFKENPDVLTAFNCASRKGNSGSPLFAPGSPRVQAVNQSSSDPATFADFVRKKFNRALMNYENHWTIKATNLRCLDVGATCSQYDPEVVNQRFIETQRRASNEHRGARLEFNEWGEARPAR